MKIIGVVGLFVIAGLFGCYALHSGNRCIAAGHNYAYCHVWGVFW